MRAIAEGHSRDASFREPSCGLSNTHIPTEAEVRSGKKSFSHHLPFIVNAIWSQNLEHTTPTPPLFAILNLTRVALTSSLHSYVSSCHSQTPNTLGVDGHWLCPLFSNEITWAPMQMLPCWNCTVPSYLQTLGCSDRAQYHYQCREEAWSCCCEAVAVAVKSKWRKHGKTAADLSSSLPQQISLAFFSSWQSSGFELEHGKGGGDLCRLRDADGS